MRENLNDLTKNKTHRGKKRKRPNPGPKSPNHLDTFFALHDFEYDSSKPATDEFHRLCRGLDKGDRKKAKKGFKDALVQEFNKIYGTDVNDIESWRGLCRVVRIAPVPDKLKECREAMEKIHVNLVDLVCQPENITIFATEVDLSHYTMETGKIFSKKSAYAGGLLKYLLRHIENPGAKRGASHTGGKHRRR